MTKLLHLAAGAKLNDNIESNAGLLVGGDWGGFAVIQIRSVLLWPCIIAAFLITAAAQQYTFTTIDVPGARNTAVQGLNSTGDLVGIYWDSSSGANHGFLLSNGAFAFIDAPGATATRVMGI